MNNTQFVIIDVNNPELDNNRLFDRRLAGTVSHTFYPLLYLAEQGRTRGMEFMTPDIFLTAPEKYPRAVLVSHMASPYTERLVAAGAVPLILFSQESPFVATRFYLQIGKISRRFKHAFLFAGMKSRVHKGTVFHDMYFPQAGNIVGMPSVPFSQKKLLSMVSRAKDSRNFSKELFLNFFYGCQVRESGSYRWQALRAAAQNNLEFDLYGSYWDTNLPGGLTREEVNKVFRGSLPPDGKIPVLSQYKFSLGFENSIFPGYVTEKIFDVFFSGSVPVYLGAPDIEKYVPENTFVDFRKFSNFGQLHGFLRNMSEAEYNGYLENIKKFLHSDLYCSFTQEAFAEKFLEIIKKER